MKFKEYLQGQPKELRRLREYIKHSSAKKEHDLMAKGYMPLSPSILKQFETKIDKVYHVTSLEKFSAVEKLQNKRKDISTFTRGSRGLSNGAVESTDLLIELSGMTSFKSAADLSSVLDRNGHRWLKAILDGEAIVNNKFTVKINKAMMKYFNIDSRFSIPQAIGMLTQNGKRDFIKWYYDESKKIITPSLIKEIRARFLEISTGYQIHDYDNNEILLHNFKINKVWAVSDRDEIGDRIKELFSDISKIKIQNKIKHPQEISNISI